MRRELEARFVTRWPTWFKIGGDPRRTLMPYGFEFGDGWFDILWRLCEGLEPLVAENELNTGEPFEVVQVKEKFGGLCFYTNKSRLDKSNDAICHLIAATVQQSLVTCDVCGQPGTTQGKHWIRTRCEAHANLEPDIKAIIEKSKLFDPIANTDETHANLKPELPESIKAIIEGFKSLGSSGVSDETHNDACGEPKTGRRGCFEGETDELEGH